MEAPSYFSSPGKGAVCCACCPGPNSLYEIRSTSNRVQPPEFPGHSINNHHLSGVHPFPLNALQQLKQTVDYLLLIHFTGLSHLQDQAIPPHTIPPEDPTVLLPCTGQSCKQAANSPEQCFLQPSAISHQLQFPSTITATARTSPWDGCSKCPAFL